MRHHGSVRRAGFEPARPHGTWATTRRATSCPTDASVLPLLSCPEHAKGPLRRRCLPSWSGPGERARDAPSSQAAPDGRPRLVFAFRGDRSLISEFGQFAGRRTGSTQRTISPGGDRGRNTAIALHGPGFHHGIALVVASKTIGAGAEQTNRFIQPGWTRSPGSVFAPQSTTTVRSPGAGS